MRINGRISKFKKSENVNRIRDSLKKLSSVWAASSKLLET